MLLNVFFHSVIKIYPGHKPDSTDQERVPGLVIKCGASEFIIIMELTSTCLFISNSGHYKRWYIKLLWCIRKNCKRNTDSHTIYNIWYKLQYNNYLEVCKTVTNTLQYRKLLQLLIFQVLERWVAFVELYERSTPNLPHPAGQH